MQDFIVSARKYRPTTFDSVVGQSALTTTLKNAVKTGKLAHAYLFCGPRGVGKTTCARIFAKAINCEHPHQDGEACNECESCKAFNEQRSLNIFELDAASNNSVDNMRRLTEQTSIPPQLGKYKVFIIDEVHMLSTQAFNAFLKTLEEPPSYVIFILATTEKHKILPTIISRCQIYDFERMAVADIVNHLKAVAEKEHIQYEEKALAFIAEKADGGMRDALSIFDQVVSYSQGNVTYSKTIEDLNELDSENYFRIVDMAVDNRVTDIMLLLNNIISKGFDPGHLVNGLASHLRNVLMAKDPQTLPLLEVSKQQAEQYQDQALKCSTPFLYRAIRLLNKCDLSYRQSSNKRLLVEITLIQVAQVTQPEDEEGVGRSPKQLKSLFRRLLKSQSATAIQVAVTEKPSESNPTEPIQTPQTTTQAQPTVTRVPKLKKLGGLGHTFASLKGNKEEGKNNEPEIIQQEENSQFTQEQLELEWRSMCNRMPQPMLGLAYRMKNITPHIISYPKIEVVADNEILLDEIMKIAPRIKATLINTLKNNDISILFRKAKPEEVKQLLSREQLLQKMIQQNENIALLQEKFQLKLIN